MILFEGLFIKKKGKKGLLRLDLSQIEGLMFTHFFNSPLENPQHDC